MFIERRLQKILFAPEERDIWSSEKNVSLLWSEAVSIRQSLYRHFAALRRGHDFVYNFIDTTLEEKR